jgi:hypothetical protein
MRFPSPRLMAARKVMWHAVTFTRTLYISSLV